MDKNIELLYAKDAIFKMISQFCHAVTDDNGNYYISNYCESALESAFTVLGIEDDNIELMKFCKMWEENNKKIWEINFPNKEYGGCVARLYYNHFIEDYEAYQKSFADIFG